jgi:hypothetical protein
VIPEPALKNFNLLIDQDVKRVLQVPSVLAHPDTRLESFREVQFVLTEAKKCVKRARG